MIKAMIAIDVALLPPSEIMDKVIAINKNFEPLFELNKTDRLPHITLCQEVIHEKDLPTLKEILIQLSSEFRPISIDASLVNEPHKYYQAVNNNELMRLHEKVMASFMPYANHKVDAEYFYDREVRPSSIDYVRNFAGSSAYQSYDPHISLGIAKPVSFKEDISFICDRLAICHLGNYNTCRKIIFERGPVSSS